jgi:pimeloyl-ACP methyl ester carboxylesterase
MIAVGIPLACILVGIAILLIASPGKPRSFRDGTGGPLAGSISEKSFVTINGVRQGMFITGRDVANPVLLFLHGGMAMPEFFLAQKYPSGLEDYFTVCWWERRGAGLSYSPGVPRETVSVDQMVSDTQEVTNYLRERFHKEKIYLMAHSGGSVIAIQAAARAPDLYEAYIAVAQMAYQLRSENKAYEYMLNKFRQMGNAGMVRRFEEAPVTMSVPLPASYMRLRDPAMHTLGVGTMRGMKSVMTGVFLESWLCGSYTIAKLNLWRGKFRSDSLLWNTTIAMDMTQLVPKLDLPVYFFHGAYDYTVTYAETKAYFKDLKAPIKGFYTFDQSAHSPMYEEPARMRRIFQEDVLTGRTSLADSG